MGVRVKWDLGEEPDESALEGGGVYTGDDPPKGMYRCRIVGARVKPDKNDNPRVNFWIEIVERDSVKKQYNGYRFYDGQSITADPSRDIQRKIWKQIAHALNVPYGAIGSKTTMNSLNKEDVEKFAGVLVDKLPEFNALCKVGYYNNTARLEITRWLPLKSDDDSDEDSDDDGDDDGEEPPF